MTWSSSSAKKPAITSTSKWPPTRRCTRRRATSKTISHNFVRKAKAGADSAITQYFFNADSYFYFVERVQKLGVDIPIVPGIMPITNYSKLARFSDACGARDPALGPQAAGSLRRRREASRPSANRSSPKCANACSKAARRAALLHPEPGRSSLAIWNNLSCHADLPLWSGFARDRHRCGISRNRAACIASKPAAHRPLLHSLELYITSISRWAA